jgi:hypothetical protein
MTGAAFFLKRSVMYDSRLDRPLSERIMAAAARVRAIGESLL